MLEHGLVESASYSMSTQVSPTIEELSGSESEAYMDVHFSEEKPRSGSVISQQEDLTNPEFNADITATMQIDSLYEDIMDTITKKDDVESDKHEPVKNQPDDLKNINVDSMTEINRVQSESRIQGDESILKTGENFDSQTPLQNVSEITQVEAVQSAGTTSVKRQVSGTDDCFSWDGEGNLLNEIDKELEDRLSPTSTNASCDNDKKASQCVDHSQRTNVENDNKLDFVTCKISSSDTKVEYKQVSKHSSENSAQSSCGRNSSGNLSPARSDSDLSSSKLLSDGTSRNDSTRRSLGARPGSANSDSSFSRSSSQSSFRKVVSKALNTMTEPSHDSTEALTPSLVNMDSSGFPLSIFTKVQT